MRWMHKFYLCLILLSFENIYGQYTDYIGRGHNQNVTVRASSISKGSTNATVNGSGMTHDLMETSRFLSQATFGVKKAYIAQVAQQGKAAWLEDQFTKQPTLITPKVKQIWDTLYPLIRNYKIQRGEDTSDIFGPWALHFNYAFWDNNMKNEDLLRQRVAETLSEILVISHASQLNDWAYSLGSYYDILISDAFSDYKTILKKVTYHPAMGFYLSHLNNPKADSTKNTLPDENYAREIMQLFTIGLYQLNMNGTLKLNTLGEPIPTYDNDDIRQMAKVFTGLGGGDKEAWVWWNPSTIFGLDIYSIKKDVPMKVYDAFHDKGTKKILKTNTLLANQTGDKDIDDALNILVSHPNTGPFLAERLIQRLVTSNPSPDYIARVAQAYYEPNASGTIGDMKKIIRAILLDPEAQNINPSTSVVKARKLRSPFIKTLQYSRTVDLITKNNRYFHNSYNILYDLGQSVLGSPTVFNFYTPDYKPLGPITDNGLVAPEFKLHNSAKSINYINMVHGWTFWDYVLFDWEEDAYLDFPTIKQDRSNYIQIAHDPEKLISELDLVFTHGQLSNQTRTIIKKAVTDVSPSYFGASYLDNRVKMAIYLLLISPDYNILK